MLFRSVERCSLPDERVTRTTLAALGRVDVPPAFDAPAVAIVGDVATGAATPESARAGLAGRSVLAGRVVLVTRPEGQAGAIAPEVTALGGCCLHLPVVRIAPPRAWEGLDAAIAAAGTHDWIVFASANGVRGFQERMRTLRRDARMLGTAQIGRAHV